MRKLSGKEQQELLKQSRHQEVLEAIRRRLPIDWGTKQETKKFGRTSKEVELKKKEQKTFLEQCYRYIFNRQKNLGYKSALENDLPIGMVEIESGHRYVIQKGLR